MDTLGAPSRFEETIRRSRFIAHAARVRNLAETLQFHESVADLQATHNCWAWRISNQYRFNDDGEPSSSAGRPILAAIEGRELDQVMIVVTRYYGGTKLGVGGLNRAYGGTASRCLDQAQVVRISVRNRYRLFVDFALAQSLHQLLESFDVEKTKAAYDGDGLVMDIRLEEKRLQEFRSHLANISRGRARIERYR